MLFQSPFGRSTSDLAGCRTPGRARLKQFPKRELRRGAPRGRFVVDHADQQDPPNRGFACLLAASILLALFRCEFRPPLQRSAGRSATAAAAYRSGEIVPDERTGRTWDYTRRQGVVRTAIITPNGAPQWMAHRPTLWNQVEARERRHDAQVAREILLSIPYELPPAIRWQVAEAFSREFAAAHGVVVDVAVHRPGRGQDDRNYHAHLLIPTRRVDPEHPSGFGRKTRELDPIAAQHAGEENLVPRWRKRWEEICNSALAAANRPERVSCMSRQAAGAAWKDFAARPDVPPEQRHYAAEMAAVVPSLPREPKKPKTRDPVSQARWRDRRREVRQRKEEARQLVGECMQLKQLENQQMGTPENFTPRSSRPAGPQPQSRPRSKTKTKKRFQDRPRPAVAIAPTFEPEWHDKQSWMSRQIAEWYGAVENGQWTWLPDIARFEDRGDELDIYLKSGARITDWGSMVGTQTPLETDAQKQEAAEMMMAAVKMRGWKSVRIGGTDPRGCDLCYWEALRQGIPVVGDYKPTTPPPADLAHLVDSGPAAPAPAPSMTVAPEPVLEPAPPKLPVPPQYQAEYEKMTPEQKVSFDRWNSTWTPHLPTEDGRILYEERLEDAIRDGKLDDPVRRPDVRLLAELLMELKRFEQLGIPGVNLPREGVSFENFDSLPVERMIPVAKALSDKVDPRGPVPAAERQEWIDDFIVDVVKSLERQGPAVDDSDDGPKGP